MYKPIKFDMFPMQNPDIRKGTRTRDESHTITENQ